MLKKILILLSVLFAFMTVQSVDAQCYNKKGTFVGYAGHLKSTKGVTCKKEKHGVMHKAKLAKSTTIKGRHKATTTHKKATVTKAT